VHVDDTWTVHSSVGCVVRNKPFHAPQDKLLLVVMMPFPTVAVVVAVPMVWVWSLLLLLLLDYSLLQR